MKKKNALVFLLGPITPTGRFGVSPVWELISNLKQFFTAEAALINEGVAVVNPANDIFALLIGQDRFSEKMAKEKSLDKLSHCDVALALPGWERSEGAKAEKEKADKLDIPVFYNLTLLLESLKVDDMMDDISEYVNSREKIISSAQRIGEAICGAVMDIIPDIEYRVVDQEDPTIIWFKSKETRWQFEDTTESTSSWEPFWSLISKVFPELEDYIADDMMYISPEMQEKIIRRLEALRGKK